MKPPTQTILPVPARLGLWDAVSIIVGIIVGAGIFKVPAEVFRHATGPGQVLLVWFLIGIPALLGALCYAELASTYPRSGGEYVYLTRAYGSGTGFLFAWGQLSMIRPIGGIAMPAFILAEAAEGLWGLEPWSAILLAAAAIAGLTVINVVGVSPGKQTQNFLTLTKVVALGGIIIAGFCFARPPAATAAPPVDPSFFLMMMAVVYTFDGWNEAAYVSREVTDCRRNLPRALILGTLSVTVLYLLINAAYLVGLGFDGARALGPTPADILAHTLGPRAGQAMNVLILISVLGALSCTIFTGARIFSELGADHRLFAPLGWWSRWQTPAWSLAAQAVVSIGTLIGARLVWRDSDGFSKLLTYTSPVFYLFFLLTGVSLFVLRWRDPATERPFRVPLYPLTPLLFCGWCAIMLVGSIREARASGLHSLAVLLAGVPLYLLSRRLPTSPILTGPSMLGRKWAEDECKMQNAK